MELYREWLPLQQETAICLQGAAPGALDGYLDSILPVMEADLFGDIAEAKEADAFAAKYRWRTKPLLLPWTMFTLAAASQNACAHGWPSWPCAACASPRDSLSGASLLAITFEEACSYMLGMHRLV